MSEIYWITRLDAIVGFFTATAVIFTILLVIGFIGSLVNECELKNLESKGKDYYKDSISETKAYKHLFTKIFKISVAFSFISFMVLIFTPSTKQAMLIYGIGGTIDYIKSNDKAKQLPDKCIDALTRYVDSIEKENKDNNK